MMPYFPDKLVNLHAMKPLRYIIPLGAIALASTGCIRKEPLNAECDIVAATLPGDIMSQNAIISNNEVIFYVKKGTDKTRLAPEFALTEGASIDPPSGTVRDFETPQTYTVTSQDRQYDKVYTVTVNNPGISLTYDFEHIRYIESPRYKYDVFYEVNPDGSESFEWASGNQGYALTGRGTLDPSTFPTYQSTEGHDGKCLVLTTRTTGTFGNAMNAPIAAGNLFIGDFVVNPSAPAKSTHFGRPFDRKPINLSGYYRYKPGETYYRLNKSLSDKLEPVPGKVDEFNIYGVLFERPEIGYLDGTNILTSPDVTAVALFKDGDRTPTDTWRHFSLPFIYLKKLDFEKLFDGKYSIAIVMSSSIDGDTFSGAPGSTLMVDQLVLTCEE